MNPKQFLLIGGVVLILVGILGFVGVIGPTADASLFGPTWYFDNAENWIHTILGVVAVLASFFLKNAQAQKWLAVVVGALALLVAVINPFLSTDQPNFLGAALQNPADTVLHLVVGIWALIAAFRKQKMGMA